MNGISQSVTTEYVGLVLASSSPRRHALIKSLHIGLPVKIMSSEADETVVPEWSPAQIVEQLSVRKARAVRQVLKKTESDAGPSVIVGADTIVVLDGEVLGKPKDANEAKEMLSRLQGRSHEVYSGIACIETGGDREIVKHRVTRVYMKPLDSPRIERYVASGEPMDKAGSYAAQGLGAVFVDRIEGCYFNVVGLSVSLLADLLLEFGIETI
ncbi:nucleoside triphosphate pyrophosphatase [Paenibacillus tarimensis]